MLARRREDGLIVREVDGETLVYDRRRHKAHCLNRAAALVWRQCDGTTSVADATATFHAAKPGLGRRRKNPRAKALTPQAPKRVADAGAAGIEIEINY